MLVTLGGPINVIDAARSNRHSGVISFIGRDGHIFPVNHLSGSSRKLVFLAGRNSLIGGVLHTNGSRRGRCLIAISGPVASRFVHNVKTKIPVLKAIAGGYGIGGRTPFIFHVALIRKLGHRVQHVYRRFNCRIGGLRHAHVVGIDLDNVPLNR